MVSTLSLAGIWEIFPSATVARTRSSPLPSSTGPQSCLPSAFLPQTDFLIPEIPRNPFHMFLPRSLICAPTTTSAAATCRPHSGHFRGSGPLLVEPSAPLSLTSLALFYFPSQSQGLCFSLWVSHSLLLCLCLCLLSVTIHPSGTTFYGFLSLPWLSLSSSVRLHSPLPGSCSSVPFSVLRCPHHASPHLLLFSARTLVKHSDPPSPAHF